MLGEDPMELRIAAESGFQSRLQERATFTIMGQKAFEANAIAVVNDMHPELLMEAP